MEHHGQQEPPALPKAGASSRTKDPSYHVFRVGSTGAVTHLTKDGPQKAPSSEEAVKLAAGPMGAQPEEFFTCLADQLKREKRHPEVREVFD